MPVLGVPVTSRVLQGLDSLLSIVQMPAGQVAWSGCARHRRLCLEKRWIAPSRRDGFRIIAIGTSRSTLLQFNSALTTDHASEGMDWLGDGCTDS